MSDPSPPEAAPSCRPILPHMTAATVLWRMGPTRSPRCPDMDLPVHDMAWAARRLARGGTHPSLHPSGRFWPSDHGARIVAVIPVYEVVPEIDVDEAALTSLTAYGVVYGFSVVRDYEPLIDIRWEEARRCVEAEARWLQWASGAQDAVRFDEILEAAPDEEAPDDFDWLFRGNDVGVAGLVLVLSAAGYATCYSCRGHAKLAGTPVPQVRLGTEPERLRLLVRYVRQAGCGMTVDGDGLASIYARSVSEPHALARLMLGDHTVFETLAPPPWRARAMEALEMGDDFERNDDEIASY